MKTAQHADGSGGHVRDCHPSMAARAACPVMVNDSLPAICCRRRRRGPIANGAESITGIVLVAWQRPQRGVRGVSSLVVMRRCGGNGLTYGDLLRGWAERDRSPGHQRPSSVVKQCRWSFQYGYSSSTKRPFSPNHVRRPRDRPVLLAQCLIVALSGRSAVLVGMSAHEAAADMSARAIRRPLMSHSGLLDIPPGKSGSEITISENRWIAGSPGLWPRPVPQRTSAMPVPRSHRAAGRTDLSAGRI